MRSSQNIDWPIRIEELHNHFKTLKYHSKMARNKVKLKIGRLLNAISSFIVSVEDSINIIISGETSIHDSQGETGKNNLTIVLCDIPVILFIVINYHNQLSYHDIL